MKKGVEKTIYELEKCITGSGISAGMFEKLLQTITGEESVEKTI